MLVRTAESARAEHSRLQGYSATLSYRIKKRAEARSSLPAHAWGLVEVHVPAVDAHFYLEFGGSLDQAAGHGRRRDVGAPSAVAHYHLASNASN